MFLTFAQAAWANRDMASCVSSIPKELTDALRTSRSQWKVLEASDLTSDDRQIWQKAKGNVCPGAAQGDFDGSGKVQYAVVLIDRKGRPSVQLIHAVQGEGGAFRVSTLYTGETSRPPVVHKEAPGKYSSAGHSKKAVEIKNDVIYFETIESGATVFFFTNGKSKKLVVSE